MTGFSFQTDLKGKPKLKDIEYTNSSESATEQIWGGLDQLFKIWPKLRKAPLFVTGESQGGLQTAFMGKALVKHKHKSFKGIAVGDPILNAGAQWPTYADTLQGMGVVMKDEREHIRSVMAKAVKNLNHCPTAFTQWNSVWNDNGGGGQPGLFYKMTGSNATDNVLLSQEPKAFDIENKWLIKQEVQDALHVSGNPANSFAEGGLVYSTMVNSGDFCINSSAVFAELFSQNNIDLMIQSSNVDPLLGPPTTEAGVEAIFKHEKASQFNDAYWSSKKSIWKVDVNPRDSGLSEEGGVAGYARCFSTLAYNRFCQVVVRNAGHMSPAQQPKSAFDMIRRFLQRQEFTVLGNAPHEVPKCHQCGGAPPFAGSGDPACYNDVEQKPS